MLPFAAELYRNSPKYKSLILKRTDHNIFLSFTKDKRIMRILSNIGHIGFSSFKRYSEDSNKKETVYLPKLNKIWNSGKNGVDMNNRMDSTVILTFSNRIFSIQPFR